MRGPQSASNGMRAALIGYTGFVGSNIARQAEFSDFFDSRNTREIRGKEFDLIVCAGAPGAKWIANKNPEDDMASIAKLMDNLAAAHADRFVLISTTDVYPLPVGVDEDSGIDETKLSPYGKHRRMLEKFVQEHFPRACIIRLPGLFGAGLKKNTVYDLLNNNCLEQIHQDGIFQFYNLENLWKDIAVGLKNDIPVLNIATEPLSVVRLAWEAFGINFQNKLSSPPPRYDMHTKYARFWGKNGPYLCSADEVMQDLKKFVAAHRGAKLSGENNRKINIGITGLGYWGPVLFRNFKSHPEINIKKICDHHAENIKKITDANPEVESCDDFQELLEDTDLDLIVIATPADTHYDLAKQALLAGKHVMVEKPFVFRPEEGTELINLAEKKGLILMVDHPHIFQKDHDTIKDIIKNNELGKTIHYHSTRADFGLFPVDTNVVWHSLYHDIYIVLDLFPGLTPEYVKAASSSHIVPGREDSAMVFIKFKEGLTAEFHACLLFPVKERKIIIVGDKKIAYWDYTAKDKIKIYEKSARYSEDAKKVEYQISNVPAETPRLENAESLKTEVDYLVDCIKNRKEPKNGGRAAIKVVNILRFIELAMKSPGTKINIA